MDEVVRKERKIIEERTAANIHIEAEKRAKEGAAELFKRQKEFAKIGDEWRQRKRGGRCLMPPAMEAPRRSRPRGTS